MENASGHTELIKLKIPSQGVYIRKIRKCIQEICLRNGFSQKQSQELQLVMNEAIANIIQHAYNEQKDKPIFVYFIVYPEKIEILIADSGEKPQPEKLKHRDLNKISEHGLGLLFMEKLVDHMAFDFSEDDKTQLKLTKFKD